MESSKAAVRYVSHVRRRLTCSAASRRQLSLRSQELAEQYAEENPDARYDDFVTAFGAPGDFAGELLSSLDGGEVETARRRRRLASRIAVACLALVLCTAVVLGWAKWGTVQKIIQGDFWVAKGVPEEVTDEAYEAARKQAQVQTNTLIP